MKIRKLLATRHIFSYVVSIGIICITAILLFFSIRSIFRFGSTFLNQSISTYFPLDTQKSVQNNIGHMWLIGSPVAVSGIVHAFEYKEERYYVLQTKRNVKYFLAPGASLDDMVGKYSSVKGVIEDFYGAIPYLGLTSVQVLQEPFPKKDIRMTEQDFPAFMKTVEEAHALKSSSVRPIPSGGIHFRSYKGYTMYFPKKIYYEVFLTKQNLGSRELQCDNAIHIVGNDKIKDINKDPQYMRYNARLIVYVCEYSGTYNAPLVDGYMHMTTEDEKYHFYIDVIHPVREDFAKDIAVRSEHILF